MPEGRGLFEVARERMRTRHLALRTETAYLQWMRRYVKFHRKHPRDMGPAEVEAFLTHLAVASKVSASTQNQALQALLFLLEAGSSLRLMEAHRLRVKDLVLERCEVIVPAQKNRTAGGPNGRAQGMIYTHVTGKGAMGGKESSGPLATRHRDL